MFGRRGFGQNTEFLDHVRRAVQQGCWFGPLASARPCVNAATPGCSKPQLHEIAAVQRHVNQLAFGHDVADGIRPVLNARGIGLNLDYIFLLRDLELNVEARALAN